MPDARQANKRKKKSKAAHDAKRHKNRVKFHFYFIARFIYSFFFSQKKEKRRNVNVYMCHGRISELSDREKKTRFRRIHTRQPMVFSIEAHTWAWAAVNMERRVDVDFMRVKKSYLPSSSQKSDEARDRDQRIIWFDVWWRKYISHAYPSLYVCLCVCF